MTKAEMAVKLAEVAGLSKAEAARMIDHLTQVIVQALTSGEKITLTGFGTFSVAQRAQREGRNPKTGDKITIPASKIVKFKPGSRLQLE